MCALVGCVVGWLVWCVCHAWWFRPLSGPKMFRQSVRTAGREVVVGCCHRIRTCGSADEPCAGGMFAWLAAARLWTQPLHSDGLMDEAESGRREHPCADLRSMFRRLLATPKAQERLAVHITHSASDVGTGIYLIHDKGPRRSQRVGSRTCASSIAF